MGYILVVDDEQLNLDMLSRRLSKKGYQTLEAESGQIALNLIEEKEVDLVLLDIRMPGMDGNQVLVKIRELYSPTELPVIMVTAEVDSSTMVKSLGLGADDYVTKPIDFPVLLARLENKLVLSKSLKEKLADDTSQKMEVLSNEDKIKKLIQAGESHTSEFKSTLRWNIHAGKMGKEIEIAWMKTVVAFLNTDGGTLLVGVADDGELLGNTLDAFKSDDKYLLHVNNSIKDFIGLEYISNIQFDLVEVEGKQILLVECNPHTEAVFLKNGNEDEFYARFGPSSKKLSTKEVLGYMMNKK